MRILEIKNNLVKIACDVNDNLALSGFVIIEDQNCPYVAQVMNLKTDAVSNFAIVKLLFTFNDEGILKNYNGTVPSLKAAVSKLPSNELLDIIPIEQPLQIGELAQQEKWLKVDKSILDNNLLICSNNLENTMVFLNNIIEQTQQDTKIIFDVDGHFDWDKKIIFSKDFKLPLNYDTINFIYNNDLNDIDAVNKAVIQDIFLEVQEYVKTLEEGYLPFETFLNVVDAQYKQTGIPQLVLLKNKLLKYKEKNVFAENLKDILGLSIQIEENETVVIDISDVSAALQKEIITYTYGVLNSINKNIYSFVKFNNELADKKMLKMLLEKTNVSTTLICPHEFKYISEIKEVAQNIVAFMPLTVQHDFASYNTYLNKLNPDEFIVYGAHTQNIPLIVRLCDIADAPKEESSNDDFSDDMTFDDESKIETVLPYDETAEQEDFPDIVETAEDEGVEESEELEEVEELPVEENDETELISVDENVEIIEEPQIPNILEDTEDSDGNIEEENYIEEVQEETEEPEISLEEAEAPLKIEDIEVVDEIQEVQEVNDIEAVEEPLTHDELVEQVSKDVDRAFYEKIPQETIDFTPLEEEIESRLSESDLNLIENFVDDEIQLAGDETYDETSEDEQESEEVPIVPIYEADDIEISEAPALEPGDRVSTAKYGEGVVEKMIKYGNKMLCSIDFPNIGRRLLDPAMTEITKLS